MGFLEEAIAGKRMKYGGLTSDRGRGRGERKNENSLLVDCIQDPNNQFSMRSEVHHISENGGVPTVSGGDIAPAAQSLSNLLFKTFSHLKLVLNFKTLKSKIQNPKPQNSKP